MAKGEKGEGAQRNSALLPRLAQCVALANRHKASIVLAEDEVNHFEAWLATDETLLLDGAMGTALLDAGLSAGEPLALAVLDHPDLVRRIHRAHIAAGARLILSHSFAANPVQLGRFALADAVDAVNHAAVTLARGAAQGAARAKGTAVWVAGGLGPIVADAPIDPDDLCRAFAEQAEALTAAGADLLWIETLGSLAELRAAVAGVRQVSPLPLVATFSFDHEGRTRNGLTPSAAMRGAVDCGVVAAGANCGHSLEMTEQALRQMQRAAPQMPLVSKANAGLPQRCGERWHYPVSPDEFAAHGQRLRAMGVRLIGGCCGTTAAHLRALHRESDPM